MKRWKWMFMGIMIAAAVGISYYMLSTQKTFKKDYPGGKEILFENKRADASSGIEEIAFSRVHTHIHEVRPDIALSKLLKKEGYVKKSVEPRLLIDVSGHSLSFIVNDRVMKSYRVAFGRETIEGDKKVEGDGRTPRGDFYICQKYDKPAQKGLGSRWLRLSYPGVDDARWGIDNGIITNKEYESIVFANGEKVTPPQKTALGGGIGIHGGSREHLQEDWTHGCIGMYNEDIEEIYDYVKVGTPVRIQD